jgi:hypothetical protein
MKNPDTLFRRVRNAQGRLIASQAMREYHPGRGTYKSAYKNAMRLARTNTNMALLLNDHLRWLQMDMVKGVKVSLSASHHIYDICDPCAGTYPKDFIFIGWHAQCLCHATPVMESEQDFLNYLRTGEQNMNGYVSQYPAGFKNYVQENYDRLSGYKSVPYWIQDNAEIINNLLK